MLQAEQVLQGRYRLQHPLGQTAGRQTWLATDIKESPAQPVIVKLLAFNPQLHWDELKLFEREAQVLKHLNHSRIPQSRDSFSVDRQAGDGLPWFGLVQEYIPGDSLQQLLDRGERFSEKQACKIANDVLEILTYLHELSPPVFHRDIKPSNLILGKEGHVYLVDFGAVQDRAIAEGVTFTVVGTNGYAPPEQLWGRTIPASDLYALGATLIHLLTGTSPADLPHRQLRIQFADRVNLTANFAQWIEQLIQPSPERRFSTARQALLALQTCQGSSRAIETTEPFATIRYGRLVGLALLQLMVISLASAIFLPNVVRDSNVIRDSFDLTKAEQSKAKNYVGMINRAQQVHYLQKSTFAESISALEIGIKTETPDYKYTTFGNAWGVFNYGVSRQPQLKSYVGAVFLVPSISVGSKSLKEEMITKTILCEALYPGVIQPVEPTYENGELTCSPGTREILR